MVKNYWDFDTINEMVPIEAVLEMHGIYPVRGKYRLREDDDHASASVHPNKKYGNIVHDFGSGNNFNPLSLTMYLQGVDREEASRILGEAFGIPPKFSSKEAAEELSKISDLDWKMLGIHPDMVSKNIDFSPEKYGIQRTMRYAERYKISMSELREIAVDKRNDPSTDDDFIRRYESILRDRAVPYVYEQKYEYLRRMNDDYRLAIAVNPNYSPQKIFEANRSDYEELAKKVSGIELVLKKVIDGTDVKFFFRTYNPEKDFSKVINGEISFEIGFTSLFDVSYRAYQNGAKVFSCVVSLTDYYKLLDNGLSELPVAAKQKGESVNMSFMSTDAGKVNYLVKALRGKETMLAHNLDFSQDKETKEIKGDKYKVVRAEAESAKAAETSKAVEPVKEEEPVITAEPVKKAEKGAYGST